MQNKLSQKSAFLALWISSAALCGVMTQAALPETDQSNRTTLMKLLLLVAAIGVFLFCNRKKLDLHYLKIANKSETVYYVVSGIILLIAAPFFYKSWLYNWEHTWVYSEYLRTIARKLGIPSICLFCGLPAGLAVCAFPALVYFLKYLLKDYLDVRRSVWEEHRYLLKTFLILAAIYCFSIIAIIRADYIYKDDMQRLVMGHTVYSRESRFAAEFITMFLHFDMFFADTSPLPQLLEMVIMALAAVIVFAAVNPKKNAGVYDIFAMLPFALTPYFLEGVSFKYDPPQHAFAVLFSAIPFLFYRGDRKKFLVVTFLCMPLMCMFHQVPMAFYPSIVILLCVLAWNRREWTGKETAIFAGQSAAAYSAGMLFYRFFIMMNLPPNDRFTSTAMWDLNALLPGMLENYRKFFKHIYSDFSIVWLCLIGVLCMAFIVLLTRSSARKKKTAILVNLGGFLLLLALSYSLYPLLIQPQYYPRHLYSFGLFVGLISLSAISLTGEKGVITKTSTIMLGCAFIVFAFIYGNALQQQKEYTEYRIEMVLDTLTEITSEHPEETYTVQVLGTTGYAPSIDAMPRTLNMVRTLVPTSFNEYFSSWSASGLVGYYGLNIRFRNIAEPDFTQLDLPLYKENYYHSIYTDGKYILISLNDR